YEEINLEIEIYGYKVNPIDTFPIERDETGLLHLTQHYKENIVDLEIILKFGKVSIGFTLYP
ncbi:unnamed protein product, partial [marine sediment metagenome]